VHRPIQPPDEVFPDEVFNESVPYLVHVRIPLITDY
jgi:hypothetical protein